MMLALRAVAVATCVIDVVVCATALALIEAVAVVSTAAMLDGADDLAVRVWQLGIARKVLESKGVEDIGESGHQASPCIRELRRS